MNRVKHVINQPFILATGFAALIHSTWALSTMFGGNEPSNVGVDWVSWLIPGLLIAFSLDVGQIATSAEIRDGNRSLAKYVTFGIFAFATYYTQWVYIAAHMPLIQLSTGDNFHDFSTALRDAGIWILPALLPLSTVLYTFSYSIVKPVKKIIAKRGRPAKKVNNEQPA